MKILLVPENTYHHYCVSVTWDPIQPVLKWIYFTNCVQTVKSLFRLHGCAGWHWQRIMNFGSSRIRVIYLSMHFLSSHYNRCTMKLLFILIFDYIWQRGKSQNNTDWNSQNYITVLHRFPVKTWKIWLEGNCLRQ